MTWLEKQFHLGAHRTTWKQECIAAFTTFSTIVYMIIVNPLILSEAGIDLSSAMTATICVAILATCLMALLANHPFVLAPGIGMAAYFTYSVVIGQGVPWQTALGIVFLAGVALLLLWLFRLRELIIDAIPDGIKIGATAGIGLFIVIIGLKNAKIIVPHPQTLVTAGNLLAPETLLSGLGIAVIAALMALRVTGAIILGILLNWILGLAIGLVQWKGVFGLPHFDTQTFLAMDLRGALESSSWVILLSFIFISLFDTAGCLMGLAHQGHFLDKKGKLPRLRQALLPDAVGTMAGGALGTSSTAVYIESGAGIAAGGRTGLTALLVAGFLLLTLFFGPLVSSIPLFATTPVLIIIGAMMLRAAGSLQWEDPSDFIPSFITIVGIPFTFSIGTGIGLGMILYPICKLLAGKAKQVHPLTWILAALFALRFALT